MYSTTLAIIGAQSRSSSVEIMAHLADKLDSVDAYDITHEQDTLSFRGGLFRLVGNWNVLISITRGEIRIDRVAMLVQYRLSFVQIVVIVSLLVCLFPVFALTYGFPRPAIIPVTCLFEFLLVGGNIATGIRGFEKFIRSSIEETGLTTIVLSRSFRERKK